MDIKSLEYFQKAAEFKSISKVANIEHISQPALSQQIQKLEASLGHKLFVRSNRGVKLTVAGEVVLRYADNIIRTYDKMLSEVQEHDRQEIKIEADFTIATYCLPCALLKMKGYFPSHNYDLISASSDSIIEDVLNDICEVGFITGFYNSHELVSQNVINEKVVLISPPNYKVSEQIELAEVLNHPLIILREKCIIKKNLDKGLNKLGYNFDDLNVITKLESIEAIKTLVQKGYGVGFVPYNAVKEEYTNKMIKLSRIRDYNLDYNVSMLTRKYPELNNEIRKFVKGFKKLGNKICS